MSGCTTSWSDTCIRSTTAITFVQTSWLTLLSAPPKLQLAETITIEVSFAFLFALKQQNETRKP
eukprot:5701525-Amphidinium_carterae.1